MSKLEANKIGRGARARLLAGSAALVSALALAAPGLAGAANSSSSITITQNTSMIVNLSPVSSTTTLGTVSWGDVSWSDSYCY